MPTPLPASDSASSDYQAFVQLLVSHEARLRSFLRSLLPDWSDVDEVLQETSLVAWQKFGRFERGTNFMAWAAAIARFEALEYLRQRGRANRVFSPEVLALIADEAVARTDPLEHERHALERCLEKLADAQRELLLLSYRPGARLHEVATQAGRTVQGYYKTVQRLRIRLLECIRQELQEETT